ncbi:Vacuolar fusion protein CCZ1-like protein B [Bienertia sinuspersici]
MGLYSSGTILTDAVKFCVFDLRRGQREGQEVEKILFFYPSESPLTEQLSVIGLSEGLITFTRIFSPDAACDVIEAERHSHVFYEAEPDVWMVMVVEKNKELEAIWRIEALRGMLKEVHSLFVMFMDLLEQCLTRSLLEHLFVHIYSPSLPIICLHVKNGILWISAAGISFLERNFNYHPSVILCKKEELCRC